MSASKVIAKGTSKWKNEGKDNHLHKKGPDTFVGNKQPKQSSPPKPSHGVGKRLMTGKGLITQGVVHLLLCIRSMPSRWLNQSLRRQTWTLVLSKRLKT